MTYAQIEPTTEQRMILPKAEPLTLPLSPAEKARGVFRNLEDVAGAFCELPSEALLGADPKELARIGRALTGALVVLRLVEGVNRA